MYSVVAFLCTFLVQCTTTHPTSCALPSPHSIRDRFAHGASVARCGELLSNSTRDSRHVVAYKTRFRDAGVRVVLDLQPPLIADVYFAEQTQTHPCLTMPL